MSWAQFENEDKVDEYAVLFLSLIILILLSFKNANKAKISDQRSKWAAADRQHADMSRDKEWNGAASTEQDRLLSSRPSAQQPGMKGAVKSFTLTL